MTKTLVGAVLVVAAVGISAAESEDASLKHARKLLKQTILIDGHNDLPWAIRDVKDHPLDVEAYDLRHTTSGQTDISRLRAGGVGGQFWSVFIPGEATATSYPRVQLEQIDIARRTIAKYPDTLQLALTADEVERAFGVLRAYYDLGVRYMTLTHQQTLPWADAAGDDMRHGGLTPFGEEVVHEMNRLGMLVDLSHVAPETMDDALRVSEAPVIFSHSSARALCDVPRNVPDDILKRMPANGGLIMITFVNAFISQDAAKVALPAMQEFHERAKSVKDAAELSRIRKEILSKLVMPQATIGQVADHVEHVRKLAGVDHVGLGGDYDGNDSWPVGLEDVSKYPYLFAELIRRGWSDADLKKLAGANLLRVLRAAEATAARLQKVRPPSLATIEQLDGTPALN
jgi:membrane dipeptidase